MNNSEFCRVMDAWAQEEAENARKAQEIGDEREHSVSLMKESMYHTMLKTIGLKAPARLTSAAEEMTARAERHSQNGDIDSADRCLLQRACIERVMELINEMEGGI